MTTGKTITLTIRAFISKVTSLLFSILSRLVIVFLPRSKSLLISWLQSPSAVILELKKIKSVTVLIVSSTIVSLSKQSAETKRTKVSGNMLLLLLLSRFSRVRLCATPYTAAHQAPRSLRFSRQDHWSGLPFPSPMHESEM